MELTATNIQTLAFDKGPDGTLPCIVQHALSGVVLMQGFVNQEALAHTLTSGQVTFYSRSKARLWTKGESSGHHLQLCSLHTDCDRDSVLALALPQGPTCHEGCDSCFDSQAPAAQVSQLPQLAQLEATITARKQAPADTSYTASLFAAGIKRAAQKVGEEGVEVALAATAGDDAELLNESADLLYHLLVVLQARDLSLNDVLAVLRERSQAR